MRFLVLSDSHGNLPPLTAALRWVSRPECGPAPDAAIFLGDGADDLAAASKAAGFAPPWYCVRGNMDSSRLIRDTLVVETGAAKLFLAHGNRHRLETGFDLLAGDALEQGAQAALFGHIHVPVWTTYRGIPLLNPGSIGRPRGKTGETFAVLEVSAAHNGAAFTARFFSLRDKRQFGELAEQYYTNI
ncbi:MAG: metallophosphoesterase [Treponema sp.]|jgi:putative phosphoesterase|nr:metallophosphoesterase [Treponema sp.]